MLYDACKFCNEKLFDGYVNQLWCINKSCKHIYYIEFYKNLLFKESFVLGEYKVYHFYTDMVTYITYDNNVRKSRLKARIPNFYISSLDKINTILSLL